MKKSVAVIILAFLAFIIFYFAHPVLNYGFIGLPFALLLLIITGILLTTRIEAKSNKANFKFTRVHRFLWLVVFLLIAYVTLVPLVTSSPMFHSQAYRGLIGEVKDGKEISNHIAPLAINKVRVVDENLAYLLGEKILGSDPALGSKAELGHFTIQKVNNELYWVAPLLHTGFFKWLNNSEGTDGYVLVSATNERDVKLVQSLNGKPLKIKYQSEAFFMSQMERYLYFNGYATTGLEDYTFEIDDEGNPYWVVTKYKKEVGFGGNNATGTVVLDAQTGVIQEYSITETPDWVDRIQPQEFIENQLNDWGEYVHGYWNFANENKLQITEGLTLVYGEDGKPYWYTGLTSVGKDESAVGFVLVDTRTKQTTYYHQSGATEYAAQRSAEGKVQEKGYTASMPVPYTINNIPTYVMTLKDGGGLVKMYAMVAISDYTIVGVGNTMNETMMAFKNVYNMADNRIDPNAVSDRKTLATVVQRIQSDIKNGNSFYYFTVEGSPKIFVGSSQLSNELPVTAAGDSISISFDVDAEQVINVSTFDNLNLGDKK
ncbi:hypothetical protein E0W68_10560 [Flavobacterium salilacus subsp. salilacus]|uniref:hypothetical protein n=1 Tax=Flavobacterium TaxID=237 RepID=UPI00107569D9|nr:MULTISPECIES: hypothetical protein [Flavobacterium]KAF2518170.1 hypothetical protein E0W68_10560 [Flavobacterium salilacus subsp. salilacus]MBE1615519.1 hypothetical protein [Flavobacterium sp. SaA2.13]